VVGIANVIGNIHLNNGDNKTKPIQVSKSDEYDKRNYSFHEI
jgi:hypothetical protein